jgi:hypothetical protein
MSTLLHGLPPTGVPGEGLGGHHSCPIVLTAQGHGGVDIDEDQPGLPPPQVCQPGQQGASSSPGRRVVHEQTSRRTRSA